MSHESKKRISLRELRRRANGGGKKRGVFSYFCWFFASLIFFSVSVGVLYASFLIIQLPSPSQLNTKKINESTKIFDKTGKVLLYEIHGEERRTIVPFEEIPDVVKNATLAAEDANFYHQPAFDWRAIVRAAFVNIREGKFTQGGSTITQQLVKNVFLTREKTITRKVKELVLAVELESKYSKDEILWFYLNQIPYGSNAYGVEAASQMFFSKSVRNLNLAEATFISSILKAPTYYSPFGSHVDELKTRHFYVIDRMVELGFTTKEEAEIAKKTNLKFIRKPSEMKAYHISLMARDYIINKYGEDLANKGGLKVITTIDWRLQEIAERVVKEGALRNSELYDGRNSALVAEDPKTGQILAIVGSRDAFADSEPKNCTPGVDCKFEPSFNVAFQGLRQPGSALKPFAYLTAFEKGYSSNTIVFDVPTEFASNNPNCPSEPSSLNKNPECFHPQNFDERFRGPTTLSQGLAQSINIPSVKILYLAGLDEVLRTVKKLGITTLTDRNRYGLSVVLGGGEVKLNELVNAYATLAQDGVAHEQSFILEVQDKDGKVMESFRDRARRVMDPQSPRIINQILSDKNLRSGLFQSSLSLTVFPDRDVALKTGTTNDYRDAWALGYTPSIAVGVWAGNNDNTPMQKKGGSILAAVPIWSAFLKEALDKYSPEIFIKPDPEQMTSKPMLNGRVSSPAHSILYYVKKSDPLGGSPSNPYEDPQFSNWEAAVSNWSSTNSILQDFVSKSLLGPNDDVAILDFSPPNGSAIKKPFLVKAQVLSRKSLSKIDLYFNSKLVVSTPAKGTQHQFSWYVFEDSKPQNVVELRAFDVSGKEDSAKSIVYY